MTYHMPLGASSTAFRTTAPALSFASLVRRLPVLSIPGGTTQRLAEIVIDRARTPIYRAGVLLTMLTGDRRYANDSNAIPRRWLPCARLSQSLGLPDELVGWLVTTTNSAAFEAAALPILQVFVRRADAVRRAGLRSSVRLSGLGAVLAVM